MARMYFADGLTLDAPRRTSDGYVAVRAHAARTGAYEYSGRDVDPDNKHGLRDQAVVHVARDASEVFDAASLGSFVGKPITDDHPTESVNAANWRTHARGVIMGAVKDGERVGFDLAFFDAPTIAKLDAGKAELSNGYSCDLEFGDFTASDGTKCQARQKNIRGNHTALVDRGRAGPEYRVNMAQCDALPRSIFDSLTTKEKPVTTMLIDGLTVDVSNADTAKATITTIVAARDGALAKVTGLEKTVTERDATIVAKDAEIVKLTADVAAAKLTPQQMRDAGKAYALVVDKAKAMGVTVTDAMDETAIMKAVVDKAMPDNKYEGDHIKIAFDALTKDAKVGTKVTTAPSGQPQTTVTDSRAFYQDAQAKRRAALSSAWTTPAKTEAA